MLCLRELLELLEDRLREYRLIDPYDNDTKVGGCQPDASTRTPPQAINARNMEQTRRELLEVATVNLGRVMFTKVLHYTAQD